jgi:hypothetical protein
MLLCSIHAVQGHPQRPIARNVTTESEQLYVKYLLAAMRTIPNTKRMTEYPGNTIEVQTYLSPGAFDLLRPQAEGIVYDGRLLHGALAIIEARTRKTLPASPEDIAFLYRYGKPGFGGTAEQRFADKAGADPVIPADQLALPLGTEPKLVVVKEEIRRPVHEIDISEPVHGVPLVRFLVDSLLYPPAEDMRLLASGKAWREQLKEAFWFLDRSGDTVSNGQKIATRQEVVGRFAGAIILKRRSSDE